MKKSLLLLLSILIVRQLTAQGVKFGVNVDPSINWLSPVTNSIDRDGVQMGISGGLVIEKYFQKNYAVQTGISIGTQGGKLLFNNESVFHTEDGVDSLASGTTVDFNLNYVTIPLSLKLKTNQIGYFSYYARLGFTNQLKIKSTAESSDGSLDKEKIVDEIRFFDIGYHFGAGIEYAISESTAFDIGVSYHNGFINISRNPDSHKMNSRVVALRLGVMF